MPELHLPVDVVIGSGLTADIRRNDFQVYSIQQFEQCQSTVSRVTTISENSVLARLILLVCAAGYYVLVAMLDGSRRFLCPSLRHRRVGQYRPSTCPMFLHEVM